VLDHLEQLSMGSGRNKNPWTNKLPPEQKWTLQQ